ncbi:MAG TPA: cytochrome c3 family protein [Xanthobacteraceae bacterium]|nr:cytochrome c3 family protein [Xanthobacteraceae bacterium]
MRRRSLILVVVSAAAGLPMLYHVAAQAPAPGAGHHFLIDKHVTAGLTCDKCHSETPPAKAPETTACIGCHGSYSQVAAKTAADMPNPHASHLGEVACTNCHHIHKASETACAQCHSFDMTTP